MAYIEIGILIIITLGSLVLLQRNFDLGMKLLIFLSLLLHKEVFSIYKWNFLPVRFFMLGMIFYSFLCVFDLFKNKILIQSIKKYFSDPFLALLSLLWVLRGVSIIFSKNLGTSLELYAFFTSILVLGAQMSYRYKNKPQFIEDLLKVFFPLSLGLSLFGFFQLALYQKTGIIIGGFWNIPNRLARVGSTFWDVNHYGALLAMLLPVVAVYFFVVRDWQSKVKYLTLSFVLTSSLLLTNSRTSWIAAFVALLVFCLIHLVKKFGYKAIIFVVSAMILVSSVLFVEYQTKGSPFRNYVKDYFHYRLDSFASHMMLLRGSIEIFERYPILGGGYGGFFEHFRTTKVAAGFFGRDPAALTTRVPPHTIWGELLAETGMLGFSVFVLILFIILIPLFYNSFHHTEKRVSLLSSAMFSSLVGIFVAGVFYSFNSEFFWLLVFIYFYYGLSTMPSGTFLTDLALSYFSSRKFLFGIIFSLALFLIFVNLGRNHLVPWDEAIYAKVAKNMVKTGNYLDLYWYPNRPWFEKPPFYMWCMAFFMNFMGFESLPARLPSAIFGFLTVLLVFRLANKLFDRYAAFFGSLALLTSVNYLYYVRAAMIDVTATFFITFSLILYWDYVQTRRARSMIFSGILVGFAVMTKGVIGLLPFAIIAFFQFLLFILRLERITKKFILDHALYLISASLIFLPWHLYAYFKFGKQFIDTYLLYHVFDRATQAIEDKGQPLWWYFIVLKVSMRLWFIPLLIWPFYFLLSIYKKDRRLLFLSSWIFVVFALFSLAKSKLVWYIMPIYPAASMFSSYILLNVFDTASKYFGFLKKLSVHELSFYVLFLISIFYFYFHKNMVYTADNTGGEARLLKLKEEKYGLSDVLYLDRVEEPLALFYLDGPFVRTDYNSEEKRIPKPGPGEKVFILGKRGRFVFVDKHFDTDAKIVAEEKDHILWYFE